ncbi:hypothetical protein D8B26_005212 [Coccidioides posadasii str. Silveira]|uniref:Annexin n=1 Tax=Coccidioides posadasii (strain RMSCC 757 / Silveira) TaxID=443226 RepID=E9D686_COCPS|nr:annexin [Coccidioides posadasii str. Silveira]QVM10554.1 hypothetical protein D8B26_005212 [Coccidioides posadasii str. Silveira]
MDEQPRVSSTLRSSSTKKRYDYDLSDDDRYKSDYKSDYQSDRGRRTPRDRYYLSDEESIAPRQSNTSLGSKRADLYLNDSESERARRSASRALRSLASSRFHQYSDAYTDSDDEGLAYGDLYYDYPVSGSERRSRSRERLRKAVKKYYNSDSSDGYTSHRARESTARTKDPVASYQTYDDPEPKLQRTHSRRDKKRSSTASGLAAKLQAAKSYFTSGIDEDEWPEIPECERPDFVPHTEQNPYHATLNKPSSAPPPPAPPPPAPVPPSVPEAPTSQSLKQTKDEEPAVRVPQYPTIPRPQYVPPEHYLKMNKTTEPSQTFATPPTQTVPPEHYLNMSKSKQPSHHLATPSSQRLAGHNRAHSTGNIPATPQQYAAPAQFQYAQPDPNFKYILKSEKTATPSTSSMAVEMSQSGKSSNGPGHLQYVEIKPGAGRTPSTRPHSLCISTDNEHLKMPGGFPDGNRPPASPLLEPYQGTYQSMSPMPWPTAYSDMEGDVSELELDDGAISSSERAKGKMLKIRKTKSKDAFHKMDHLGRQRMAIESMIPTNHVPVYDPRIDAKALKSAISHHKIDPKPLLEILPNLTAEEVLVLRAEYKNIVKMTGHGVNIAKHIALRVPGNFGKACHATALGQWESEAYWANFWYRSNSSRRELLIEALMGRPNAEIRRIKNCFKDKRYSDSLEKCMKAELKPDKFRAAILLALEEKRQADMAPISLDLVRRDVQDLHRALISREGGESAMIQIIVVRGNGHLCEVMRMYESMYNQHFARAMIAKSPNLVGESLIHILNGALNRPMRDALLLHHAIAEVGTGRDRAELLISRLVRMHWEPHHLERAKAEYKRRYGKYVEDHIVREIINKNGNGKCDWAEFCIELVKGSTQHVMDDE